MLLQSLSAKDWIQLCDFWYVKECLLEQNDERGGGGDCDNDSSSSSNASNSNRSFAWVLFVSSQRIVQRVECVYTTICFAYICENVRVYSSLLLAVAGSARLVHSVFEQIVCSFINYKNHTQICFQCVSFSGYCGARDTSRLFPYGSVTLCEQTDYAARARVCVCVYRKHIQAYVICKNFVVRCFVVLQCWLAVLHAHAMH